MWKNKKSNQNRPNKDFRKKKAQMPSKIPSNHHLVMGRNCVEEILRYFPERITRVYTAKDEDEEHDLSKNLQKASIEVLSVSKVDLTDLVRSESHQSYVAIIKDQAMQPCADFLKETKEKKSLVLMLDSIYDPQNFGTLLRAAECFGVDAVIYSKNRGCDITPVVSKASVGASELVNIIKVSNLAETARKFQKADYQVITAELREGASSFNDFTFSEKTLLVVGSEGKGVQRLLSELADDHLMIPMKGKIQSLNVSQATSIILSRFS